MLAQYGTMKAKASPITRPFVILPIQGDNILSRATSSSPTYSARNLEGECKCIIPKTDFDSGNQSFKPLGLLVKIKSKLKKFAARATP